jgi:uncharacterized RDD family membrane protein YckC
MEEVVHAGFWRRAAALFVDLAIVSFLLWAIGLVIGGWSDGWVIAEWGGATATSHSSSSYHASWGSRGRVATGDPVAEALLVLYFLVPEALAQRATPGKRMLGLAVAGADGLPITAGRALARNLLKPVSILTFGLGYALAGVTRRKQALHDLLSDCTVVRVRERG